MKIYTEFVVLHDDVPMPDEEAFCPSFWKADDFDSDGDYYATGTGGRWSDLTLRKVVPGGVDSVLTVRVLRATDSVDGHELQRFLDNQTQGLYADLAADAGAVTALAIETADLADYREFLQTVDMFLGHTGGVVISPFELDRESFTEDFLGD